MDLENKLPDIGSIMGASKARPDLAGKRVRDNSGGSVYMVNPEGSLQEIPDKETYARLFDNEDGIVSMDLHDMAFADPIVTGSFLLRAKGGAAVYFVSNNTRRWVVDADSMTRSHFSWSKIVEEAACLVDSIPEGPNWKIPPDGTPA